MHHPLAPFTVHVRLGPEDDAALTLRQPNLYNLVALQLTIYVAPISRCANGRCRRPFTVQRSGRRRYEATHHASGVR